MPSIRREVSFKSDHLIGLEADFTACHSRPVPLSLQLQKSKWLPILNDIKSQTKSRSVIMSALAAKATFNSPPSILFGVPSANEGSDLIGRLDVPSSRFKPAHQVPSIKISIKSLHAVDGLMVASSQRSKRSIFSSIT